MLFTFILMLSIEECIRYFLNITSIFTVLKSITNFCYKIQSRFSLRVTSFCSFGVVCRRRLSPSSFTVTFHFLSFIFSFGPTRVHPVHRCISPSPTTVCHLDEHFFFTFAQTQCWISPSVAACNLHFACARVVFIQIKVDEKENAGSLHYLRRKQST